MLSVEEARSKVLDAVEQLDEIEVPIRDAIGLALADDAVAPHPLPRFDNSAMDGYAVRSTDCREVPVELEVIGEVRAGDPGDVKVLPGTAARIMTGAALPPGADGVIQIEETEERDGRVAVGSKVAPGRNVRPAGDDIAQGDVVVRRGAEIGAGEAAVLASRGLSPIAGVRRPRVALLVTGDELVAPEEDPAPGQIRDSNSLALKVLVEEAGGEVVLGESVVDDRAATLRSFAAAAARSDLVVSSGGVAVGRYDYVKDVVEELGRIDMWRVAMQPGKPVVLGRLSETPFLGLPGNPVSIHIGFEQFVRPVIRKMRGCTHLLRPTLSARLTEPVEKRPGRLHFVRVELLPVDGGWRAAPRPQGSHIQSSLVGAHGVARFPLEDVRLEAGAEVTVEVWRLPDR